MENEIKTNEISVTWRGKKYVVTMDLNATLEELGHELQKLTEVKADTLKLIVQSRKASKLLSPFSEEHSHLTLQESSIEGKPIQMMGVPKEEIDQVLKSAKTNMRIAGFDEEEKRMKQRISNAFDSPLKLPQGNYVFGDFRTLELPGIKLNPPPSEALRLMHTLAADKGIVAIMNKHKWRVGIMTEMAPEGYVGVSAMCILGFNKNKGEEISLRLRTDDLKGFRKYQSIKKTLLHELAHMVFSEHDAKFFALNSQLNKEADALDWTRSTGHTLSGSQKLEKHVQDFHVGDNTYNNSSNSLSHKLGGSTSSELLANARASSVAAAYNRLVIASSNPLTTSDSRKEPDPDDSMDVIMISSDDLNHEVINEKCEPNEPDPDDSVNVNMKDSDDLNHKVINEKYEPDPDASIDTEAMESEPCGELDDGETESEIQRGKSDEPDPDDSHSDVRSSEPDPDASHSDIRRSSEPDPDASHSDIRRSSEPDPDASHSDVRRSSEPDPDDGMLLNDEEIQRIQDPVVIACNRLNKSIQTLQSEVSSPSEAAVVFQTLVKIVKNVIEHPNETKFKKLRKGNPVIQKNVASHNAAMEILFLIGFCEDVVQDEIGRAEAYLVLKRNDPGLLWLAKSSLETCIAF